MQELYHVGLSADIQSMQICLHWNRTLRLLAFNGGKFDMNCNYCKRKLYSKIF